MNYKTLFFCCLLSGVILLTGCDDKKAEVQESSTTQQSLSLEDIQKISDAEDARQREILKYNAYVDTVNYQPYNRNFSDEVEKHQGYVEENINARNKLTSYYAIGKSVIEGKKQRLEKALAIKASIIDLDASAEKYLNALNALAPVNEELSLYADTKEYLTDDGKIFREKEPVLVALLKATASAEDEFENKITEHDTVLIKKQFESQEKDTFLYYRNGIVYYEKIIIHEVGDLMQKNNAPALAKLDEDTNTLSSLFKGYLKTKKESNLSCESDMKSFISTTRTMSQKMKDNWDKYTKVDPVIASHFANLNMPVSDAESDYKNMMNDFSTLVENMNADRC